MSDAATRDAAEAAARLLGGWQTAHRFGEIEVSLHVVTPGAPAPPVASAGGGSIQPRSAWSLPGTSRGFSLLRPGLLLVIQKGDFLALGEASPLPGFGGHDTLARATSDLAGFDWARLDRPANHPPSLADFTRLTSDVGSPSARHAVEGAALNLWAVGSAGPSLLAALAGPNWAPSPPRSRSVQPSTVLDPLGSGYEGALTRALDDGYRTLKLKCGRNLPDELAAIRRVAQLSSKRRLSVSLRLDANLAFDAASALAIVDGTVKAGFSPRASSGAISGLTLDWIEDPTPNLEEWRSLGACCLVAADEVLVAQESRVRAFDSGARVFIAKPMMLGGVTPVLDLARRARGAGAIVSLSHTFDGPVALALALRLAGLLQPAGIAAGLGQHAALEGWTTATAEPPFPVGLRFPPERWSAPDDFESWPASGRSRS